MSKQVVWAVRPILRENNKKELREYCDLFKNTDTTITIYDDNNLLIGTPHENFSKTEGTEVDALMVNHTVPLKIADKDYTLIVSTATKHMEKTLTKYQKYIVISVLLGVLIVVILGVYLLNTYWHSIACKTVQLKFLQEILKRIFLFQKAVCCTNWLVLWIKCPNV